MCILPDGDCGVSEVHKFDRNLELKKLAQDLLEKGVINDRQAAALADATAGRDERDPNDCPERGPRPTES